MTFQCYIALNGLLSTTFICGADLKVLFFIYLDTTFCDKVCQWLAKGLYSGTPVSSTNKAGCHDILTEILLKVALNTIPSPQEVLLYVYSCNVKIADQLSYS